MPSPTPGPIRDATSTQRGLMSTVAQTFAGMKTFLNLIRLALMPTVEIPSGGTELEGSILYDSTAKRIKVHTGTTWSPVALSTSGGGSSLEEHIASTEAHSSGNITWSGGASQWQDETPFSPSNLDDAVLDNIVDTLAGPYGARKIGTNGGGGLTGLNIQEQLDELYSIKVGEETLADTTGAGMVGAAPGGSLSSTTVQAQLYELRDEKASLSGASFTGPLVATGYSGGPVSGTTGSFSGSMSASGYSTAGNVSAQNGQFLGGLQIGENAVFNGFSPISTTPFSTATITPRNINRVHGRIYIQAGTVTVRGGFNLLNVSISGNNIIVTFASEMYDTDYSITSAMVIDPTATGNRSVGFHSLTTSGLQVRAFNESNALLNPAISAFEFSFTILGK